MRQTCIGIAVALVASFSVIDAQQVPDTPAASLAFEVASVKRDPKQGRGAPRRLDELTLSVVRVLPGGRVESYGHMLRNLIAWAYDVNTLYQKIEGTQEILETELVIEAKAADPSLTPADARAMVRTLLEERFQLRWRLQHGNLALAE
jgi:uncharacterized protein (TIGR03435 family)